MAAPSFVLPGNIVENVRFLAGRVEEVALCFFENAACLAYTEQDLPPDLRDLPLERQILYFFIFIAVMLALFVYFGSLFSSN